MFANENKKLDKKGKETTMTKTHKLNLFDNLAEKANAKDCKNKSFVSTKCSKKKNCDDGKRLYGKVSWKYL